MQLTNVGNPKRWKGEGRLARISGLKEGHDSEIPGFSYCFPYIPDGVLEKPTPQIQQQIHIKITPRKVCFLRKRAAK